MIRFAFFLGSFLTLWQAATPNAARAADAATPPLKIVVMDPLAAPLSCECVKGYAQRDYTQLAAYLEAQLQRRVEVVFNEQLFNAVQEAGPYRTALIIGKQSVVLAEAAEMRFPVRPILRLTDKEGLTTQTGLFVVPSETSARKLQDLKGYRLFFGSKSAVEKHSAALEALEAAGVPRPEKIETSAACSGGVQAALDYKGKPGAAAVISSYAIALLEGCGTVQKGALRVVGKTRNVPFITVFGGPALDPELEKKVAAAMLRLKNDPDLLKSLESKNGFVPFAASEKSEPAPAVKPSEPKPSEPKPSEPKPSEPKPSEPKPSEPKPSESKPAKKKPAAEEKTPQKKKTPAADGEKTSGWPGFRGPNGDGLVAQLPRRLPAKTKLLWTTELTGAGLAGLAATADYVIVADRDLLDTKDVFRCLSTVDGSEVWMLEYLAKGELDYGNSPRATPRIVGNRVFLLGAFGDLHCVDLKTGNVVWKKNVLRTFGTKPATWGVSASPLVVDGKLIVNPGARNASVVALNLENGETVWTAAGEEAAYASFIVETLGGVRQLIGYDAVSLGGWNLENGQRLWTLTPSSSGDYNVPTPIAFEGKLFVATENNGARLYRFTNDGRIDPKPAAENPDFLPSMVTPVVIDGRLYGASTELFCLDLRNDLKTVWRNADPAFKDYSSILGSQDRLLVASHRGELLLVDPLDGSGRILSRSFPFGEESTTYSHPALLGNRLYFRGESQVGCILLDADAAKENAASPKENRVGVNRPATAPVR